MSWLVVTKNSSGGDDEHDEVEERCDGDDPVTHKDNHYTIAIRTTSLKTASPPKRSDKRASRLLGSSPHLPPLSTQSAHSLLSPLCSHLWVWVRDEECVSENVQEGKRTRLRVSKWSLIGPEAPSAQLACVLLHTMWLPHAQTLSPVHSTSLRPGLALAVLTLARD